MDIHKPKPWQGKAEFLKEIGTIVIGVLIALGAEQAVELLHWRHEVADAREALGREIALNIQSLQFADSENGCIRSHLDGLQAWADGDRPRPTGPVLSPVFIFLTTSTWEVTNSGQVVSHYPLDLRTRYAEVYGRLHNQREVINDERHAWAVVVALANERKLNDQELSRLREAIGLTRVADSRRRGNSPRLIAFAAPLAVGTPKPITDPANLGDLLATCIDASGGT